MSDLAWAAGLFEGEGCISIVKNYKSKFGLHAKLCLQMNDKQIVERFAEVFPGVGRIYPRPPRGASQESWAWTVYKRDDVESVLDMLEPWFGSRRQKKSWEARELIARQNMG